VITEQEKVSDVSEVDSVSTHSVRTTRRHRLILAGILVGAGCLYFLAYNPGRFGLSHDDGIYVSTAKALATGEGYRLISLPYAPAQTKYPPFYPFLLSLIWRVDPRFPGNTNAMVVLSAVATLIFLGVTWRYLVVQRYAANWQALTIVALTAVNWRTMILATTTYSEMIFAALSVVVLLLAEGLERRGKDWVSGSALGVAIGLAFLTRSAGVALLAAVAVYFILRKRFRVAILPLAIGGLFVLGWIGWCYINRTTITGINVAYYTSYAGHLKEVLHDLQVQEHTSYGMNLLSILGTNALMLIVVSVPVVCLALEYNLVVYLGFAFLFIAAGFVRDVLRGWRLLHIYTICYLVLHLFWLPYVSYDRFLIPILPFLLLWWIRELETMALLAIRTLRSKGPITVKASAMLIGLAFVAMVSVTLYNYASNLYFSASAPLHKEVKPIGEHAEAIEWIRANTDPSDVVICDRDPIYYLYTGRKSAHFLPMSPAIDWRNDPKPIFDIVRESNGKYLVLTSSDFEFKSFKELVDDRRDTFVPVFTSSNGLATIYRIHTATARLR
jgi:hypothetical protein